VPARERQSQEHRQPQEWPVEEQPERQGPARQPVLSATAQSSIVQRRQDRWRSAEARLVACFASFARNECDAPDGQTETIATVDIHLQAGKNGAGGHRRHRAA
jgi:hypothetical protein